MLRYDIGILIIFISLLFKKNTISFYVLFTLFIIASLFNVIEGFEISNFSMLLISVTSLSFFGDYSSTWKKSRFVFILLVSSILISENNFLSLTVIYFYTLIIKNLAFKKYEIRNDFIGITLLSLSLIFYVLATQGLKYDPYIIVEEFYANFFIVGITLFALISSGIFFFNTDDISKRVPLYQKNFITILPKIISLYIFYNGVLVVQNEVDFELLNVLKIIIISYVILDNILRILNCITYKEKNNFQLTMSGLSFILSSIIINASINQYVLYSYFSLALIANIIKNTKSNIVNYSLGLISFLIYISSTTLVVLSMYGKINSIMFYIITMTYVVVSYVYLKIISVEYGSKIHSKIQKSNNNTSLI